MAGKKNEAAAATEEVAAETAMTPEAVIAALEEQLAAKEQALQKAVEEKQALQKAFDQYREDAKEILAEAGKAKVITSDKPILNLAGELFVFQMGAFHLQGKKYNAAEICDNPAAFADEIEALKRLKILKPFKAE